MNELRMILEEKRYVHEEKDVHEYVCPPKIPYLFAWTRNQISAGVFHPTRSVW